jgi:hypothetical protein
VSWVSDTTDAAVTGGKDPVLRARVKSVVALAQTTFRQWTASIFRPSFLKALGKGDGLTAEQVAAFLGKYQTAEAMVVDLSRVAGWVTPHFDAQEDVFLPESKTFILGTDAPTAGDYAIASEVLQCSFLVPEAYQELLARRPAFARWVKAIEADAVFQKTIGPAMQALAALVKGGPAAASAAVAAASSEKK